MTERGTKGLRPEAQNPSGSSTIERLRKLEKAATPGPWVYVPGDSFCADALLILR